MLKALFYPGEVPFDTLMIPAIFYEIHYDGIYLDIINVLDKEKKDPVIVDIGANIGITTQYFRDHAKKVYSVEPASEHFEALSKNREFNHWDNVEIFNYAIADRDGEMELSIHRDNRTTHSLIYKGKLGSEKVTVKKLTTFFKENGIKHVDFMKLDVEGAEEWILPSPDFEEASKIIDNITIEFHNSDFPKHVNRMIQLGYQARRYTCSAIVFNFNK